jgi:hypothetical protein
VVAQRLSSFIESKERPQVLPVLLKILTFERFIFHALLRSGFAVTTISDDRYLKLVLLFISFALRISLLKTLLLEAFSFSSFVD